MTTKVLTKKASGLSYDSKRPVWKEKPSLLYQSIKAVVLVLFSVSILAPMLLVVSTSLADNEQLVAAGGFVMWPERPTLEAYEIIFRGPLVLQSLGVSLFITVVGTLLALFVTITMAYATSRSVLFGRPVILAILFTLLFAPGLIPSFLMIRELGLLDSLWSLILPGAFGAFNFVVMRSFFMNIPGELIESARIDGASDWQILWKIVLPLSKAVVAVVGLFYAVGFWNSFFNALLYINDHSKWPIQLLLRNFVVQGSGAADQLGITTSPPPQSIQMAVVVVALVPILMVYPFLQKHFAKGVITGAVKG
ncbi:carbohydrate ABC transporter permease [Pseudarthrobacter sp. AL07]|uniref:carbohydrate ABC transporter permease n=1 Tax=unclassified Pseudarthrobacter TaxID=2647000 RepID=UPI001624E87A|nr:MULTISPECIES: carbohydrate ABC transporter permease [unclassified Pseudarthrobacter]MDI3195886.1 carbohydrate ABC transporter permease [Pseudarthrobacter sp. AL20]MDI3209958.1 carbohydrate ABC transporter permease [Pseudarthrobacter sp. AL07]QNE13308.1 carbohydrate ABC transporter permease [Pseudarthrobacter sp. NBSH8]